MGRSAPLNSAVRCNEAQLLPTMTGNLHNDGTRSKCVQFGVGQCPRGRVIIHIAQNVAAWRAAGPRSNGQARLAIAVLDRSPTLSYAYAWSAGEPMKAQRLIANAVYGPAELKAVGKAFDDAWEQVGPQVSSRAAAIEAARLKLAELVLSLSRDGVRDPQELAESAVRLMLSSGGQRRHL
jgi:hypothetical protein